MCSPFCQTRQRSSLKKQTHFSGTSDQETATCIFLGLFPFVLGAVTFTYQDTINSRNHKSWHRCQSITLTTYKTIKTPEDVTRCLREKEITLLLYLCVSFCLFCMLKTLIFSDHFSRAEGNIHHGVSNTTILTGLLQVVMSRVELSVFFGSREDE